MIKQGMMVTIEKGDDQKHGCWQQIGRSAEVLKVIGPFAVLKITSPLTGSETIRGCLVDYLQPKVTLAYLFGHSKTQTTEKVS